MRESRNAAKPPSFAALHNGKSGTADFAYSSNGCAPRAIRAEKTLSVTINPYLNNSVEYELSQLFG
jgi:hypothetical protein